MKKMAAVFTIVQGDPIMTAVWSKYYERELPGHCYILHHERETPRKLPFVGPDPKSHVVPVHHATSFDHTWMNQVVSAFQRFLLMSYDYVLFTEIDEIVTPDRTKHKDLASYIRVLSDSVVRCNGFNLWHDPEQEGALDSTRPILSQRSTLWRSLLYSKPLLANRPVDWTHGFHSCFGAASRDDDLWLVHLKRMDYETCRSKVVDDYAERNWSLDDVRTGMGSQNRISDEDKFRQWYFHEQLGEKKVSIPEWLKTVI